jgi:hypothetical protein
MQVGTLVNNPQISGKGLFYKGGESFEIEGVKEITLEQVKQLHRAGFIQWASPDVQQKVLSYVPATTATTQFPMPGNATGNVNSTAISLDQLNPVQGNAPQPLAAGPGFPGQLPGMPMPMPMASGPRTIGWGFLKFLFEDRGGNIPAEVKKFNIGALLLGWIWPLFNGLVKTGLLTLLIGLIPGGGLVMAIYLGIYGNQIAWAANPNRWTSAEYLKKQKVLAIVAIALLLVGVLITVGVFVLFGATIMRAGSQK